LAQPASVETEVFFDLGPGDERLARVPLNRFLEIAQVFEIFYAFTEMIHLRSEAVKGRLGDPVAARVLLIRIFSCLSQHTRR
jgi:hypothetical protein